MAAGVVFSNIDHYEAGRREIPISRLEMLAQAYGLQLVLDLVESDRQPVYASPRVGAIIAGLDGLPDTHKVLVLHLIDLAIQAPPIGVRAASAMLESMLGDGARIETVEVEEAIVHTRDARSSRSGHP